MIYDYNLLIITDLLKNKMVKPNVAIHHCTLVYTWKFIHLKFIQREINMNFILIDIIHGSYKNFKRFASYIVGFGV